MMPKFMRSPVGIGLTAAAIVLTLSPRTRQATRQWVVRGIATVLGIADQVRYSISRATEQIKNYNIKNVLPLKNLHDEENTIEATLQKEGI